jgi:hypothetical protein
MFAEWHQKAEERSKHIRVVLVSLFHILIIDGGYYTHITEDFLLLYYSYTICVSLTFTRLLLRSYEYRYLPNKHARMKRSAVLENLQHKKAQIDITKTARTFTL